MQLYPKIESKSNGVPSEVSCPSYMINRVSEVIKSFYFASKTVYPFTQTSTVF